MIEEMKTVREAVFFMRNINECIDEIARQVDNKSFKYSLSMLVSFPLKKVLNNFDEWHDMEVGMNALTGEKLS